MRFLFLILAIAPVLGAEIHSHIRERRQAQVQQPNYRAYSQAPAAIKQILAAQQARDPIVNFPAPQIPNLSPSKPIEPQYLNQADLYQYRPHVEFGQVPEQPTYKNIPVRPAQYNPPASYNPPSASQYRPVNYAQQQQQQPQQQQQQASYAQPNYQYSKNLPPQLQQLVQLQQNLPNAIPQGQQRG